MRKFFGFTMLGMMAGMLTSCSLNGVNGLINGSGLDVNALIDQVSQWINGGV